MINDALKETKHNLHGYEDYSEKQALIKNVSMLKKFGKESWEIRLSLIDKLGDNLELKSFLFLLTPNAEVPILDKVVKKTVWKDREYEPGRDYFTTTYTIYFKNKTKLIFDITNIADVLRDYYGIVGYEDIRDAEEV